MLMGEERTKLNLAAMQAANQMYWLIWSITPVKTGNLRNNSLQMLDSGDEITIFYDDIIAPYINKSPRLMEKLDNISGFINNMFNYYTGAIRTSTVFEIPDYRDSMSMYEMAHKDDYLQRRGLI
jgi:hypothetical protein